MLVRTGSHGRAVWRRVPEMRRIVEFNCSKQMIKYVNQNIHIPTDR